MIVSLFSLTWLISFALVTAFGVVSCIMLNRKDMAERRIFFERLSIAVAAFFIFYKAWIIWWDPGYTTNIWRELPFNLCNISILLFYPAVHFDLKHIRAFLFYCCTLGVVMALLMPSKGFYGYPIYTFRTFAYLYTHLFLLIMSNMLVALDLYRPSYSDIIPSVILITLYALFAHGLNALFRVSGLAPDVNYCFTYGIEGNPVTELMMKYIPYPYLFLVPFALPLGLFNCLMCFVCNLIKKK